MDKVAFGIQIQDILEQEKPDCKTALALIGEQLAHDVKASTRAFIALTETVVKGKDLAGAVACVAFYAAHSKELSGVDLAQMREVIRRSASTTEEKLFVDSIGLNTAIATAIVNRLSVLLALKPGVYVSSQSWGFGQVQSIDSFYGKVIIDFEGKKDHAMSLSVAGQNLSIADDGHLMTRYLRNKQEILDLRDKHPADLVRLMLTSYGAMPVQRLADRLAEIGLVPATEWKHFWEAARRSLKNEKTGAAENTTKKPVVDIPAKRNEPIRLLEEEEDFGEKWLKRFARERDVKTIYDGVLAMLSAKQGKLPDGYGETIANRLNFALKGTDKTDYARYAQIAVLLRKLELSTPEEQMRQADTLLEQDEQDNLLLAVHGLSTRDVTALIAFLLAVKPESKSIILDHLTQFNGVALSATLGALTADAETGAAVTALLARRANPVPTLVVWALRNRAAYQEWRLPSLNALITQAIHIIEQRLTGEGLKMRNTLQGFFDNPKWLEPTCNELSAFERQVIFERIQASPSWDTASQRNILVRMVRFDPTLGKLRRAIKALEEHPHLTSLRSLTAYQLAYDHLVKVEIPKNVKDIATARSFGDLRENSEYQYAKDKQRVLLSQQTEMDRILRPLKVTDFANVSCETAAMGTRVTISTAAGKTTYTILGELDRDEKLNIISCRSRLATALLGKKVNASVELPAEKGTITGTITAIEPLDDAVKAWLADIPTQYVPTV